MLSANFGSHFLSAFSNFFTKRFSSFLQVYLIFSLIFSHILYYIFQCYSLCQCAVLNDYHKAYFCLCYPRSVFPSAFCPNFWVYKIIFCGGVITHFFLPEIFSNWWSQITCQNAVRNLFAISAIFFVRSALSWWKTLTRTTSFFNQITFRTINAFLVDFIAFWGKNAKNRYFFPKNAVFFDKNYWQ